MDLDGVSSLGPDKEPVVSDNVNDQISAQIKYYFFKFRDLVFPYGNWRFHFVYLTFLFVIFVGSYMLAVTLGILDYGIEIKTDTFTAYMPYFCSHMGWDIPVAFWYSKLNLAIEGLFVFEICSLVADALTFLYYGWLSFQQGRKNYYLKKEEI